MLFCCGIAVGFFLFGVGEPVYYYRQPTYWKGWAYDYNLRKVQVNDRVAQLIRAWPHRPISANFSVRRVRRGRRACPRV